MKKIFFAVIASLFLIPFGVFAACQGEAWRVITPTTKQGGMMYCACAVGATGTYPDCHCPSGTEWSGDSCVSTGGGTQGNACRNAGGTWSNGTCSCGASYGWTGSSCYPCGVNIPEQGAFCGSGCAGYGGCAGSTGGSGTGTTGGGATTGNAGGGTITTPTTTSTGQISNPIKSESFAALIDAVINWILNIALVLAPLIIVYGGFMYMTAAGDTNKVSQAKSVILYAVIGFIVALMAKSLINMFVKLIAK